MAKVGAASANSAAMAIVRRMAFLFLFRVLAILAVLTGKIRQAPYQIGATM
jgi:hypothetical protein